MALSDINICNMALGKLGRSINPIQSFTENSVEAKTCLLWYDQARRELLELHDWSFARARITMALHSDAPPSEWVYRYQMPSDCLLFRRIWNPLSNNLTAPAASVFSGINFANGYWGDLSNTIPWELEDSLDGQTTTLLTNQANAVGIYTREMLLVQRFSPNFSNCLAWFLAQKMAISITGKNGIEETMQKGFLGAMKTAAASDANQGVAQPIRDGYSVRARA